MLISTFALAAFCVGCNETPIVTKPQLERLKSQVKEPKVSVWYYVGTKDGFHYFTHWDLNGRKTYRISETEQNMENPIPLTSNEKAWRVMYWGVQALNKPKDREWEPNTPSDRMR